MALARFGTLNSAARNITRLGLTSSSTRSTIFIAGSKTLALACCLTSVLTDALKPVHSHVDVLSSYFGIIVLLDDGGQAMSGFCLETAMTKGVLHVSCLATAAATHLDITYVTSNNMVG